MIPLSEGAKAKVDVVAMPSAMLGYFQMIPWAELAAALACLYTALRVIEMVIGWLRKKP
jgi:hypothetical protein